jgi:hypothetical protein
MRMTAFALAVGAVLAVSAADAATQPPLALFGQLVPDCFVDKQQSEPVAASIDVKAHSEKGIVKECAN